MASDPVKAYTTQQAQQPNNSDLKIDEALQSLLIDDSELKHILKGEVHEDLNRLKQMMTWIEQRASNLMEYFDSMKQDENKVYLTQLLQQFPEVKKQVDIIQKEIHKYKRYVPYLLLFTSTSVLSNIDKKEAQAMYRKVDLMITRDELDCQDEDESLGDKNIFEVLRIRAYLHIFRNVEGWTFKGIVEEKRSVTNLIRDDTGGPKRKKILGVL